MKQRSRDQRVAMGLMGAALAVVSGCVVAVVVVSWQWPLISDAALMRYADFMIRHGFTPYTRLVDVNLPGSYVLDEVVTATAGFSPLAWRLFDLVLDLSVVASFAALTFRRWWGAPGAVLGGLFAVMHAADGLAQMGQRDLVVAVLLVVSLAVLLTKNGLGVGPGNRLGPSGPGLSLPGSARCFLFGAGCGLASCLKPQALLFLVAGAPYLVASVASARREGKSARWVAAVLWACAGALLPPAAVLCRLWRQGALGAFVATVTGLMPYHASLARHTVLFLLSHAVPGSLVVLLGLASVSAVRSGSWRKHEQQAALVGVAFGIFSFCLQGKAYPYHRYPLIVFLLLFAALELGSNLAAWNAGRAGWVERSCAALTLVCCAWLGPLSVVKAWRYDWRSQPALEQLQADLRGIAQGGYTTWNTGTEDAVTGDAQALDGRVQCMDTMAGCLTVLDRMQVVQSTGFLYDCYFFVPGESAVKEELRRRFLEQVEARLPLVFVVTDQWCLNQPSGYDKLKQWPAFEQLLGTRYRLAEQRAWTGWNRKTYATYPFGYRIYALRGAGG